MLYGLADFARLLIDIFFFAAACPTQRGQDQWEY